MNSLSSGTYSGVKTNIRTLGMRLRSDIPCSVQLLGYYVRVLYARQPRTCFRCGLLGHQAAGCTADPVNLFREEDFPPLPLEEDSGGEEVSVPFAAAAPPVSPDVPPVVADPPPGVAVPSDVPPDHVSGPAVPVDLPGDPCGASPSASSSSTVDPGPASSPRVPPVLGAGLAAVPPAVCGPVPPVVEAAAVLRRASVRPIREARGSGSASGCEDVRPVPKRSRRSSTTWADAVDYDAGGASGDDVAPPGASRSTTLVEADVHVSAVDDVCTCDLPPVLSPAEGSPQWGGGCSY
ncbi:BUB3-interacting and GLEBS motif-containing protein ZNF207-like [Procambarus clarkii]|uniref:BUB3-interacting and GLEBS motif-containing protein ZNF207-like n=1 Tax=Procambarus clarkii TaxID=6728 RepID=UPI0037421229